MLDTDSALLNLIVAPVLAAALHSRPMLDTDSATTRLSHPSWLQFAFPCTPHPCHASRLGPALHEDPGTNAKPLGY